LFSRTSTTPRPAVPLRLGAQLVAASAFAYARSPVRAPLVALGIVAVLWMSNLYNFMDGSDGLAGGMTLIGFAFLGAGAWVSGDAALTPSARSSPPRPSRSSCSTSSRAPLHGRCGRGPIGFLARRFP